MEYQQHPQWAQALRQVAPIVLGYVPVGFAYGVLARQAGLDPAAAILMSVLVFAGSAQFIAISLISTGASLATIAATTFVVNLRHALMAAALAPYLRSWSWARLAAFAAQLTDETFALHAHRFAQNARDAAETLTINGVAHTAWCLGSALGAVAGGLIHDVRPWGLDFALPAMFLALLGAQLGSAAHILAATSAALLTVLLHAWGVSQSVILIATITATTLALGVDTWKRSPSSLP